jgi:hypothetical protein
MVDMDNITVEEFLEKMEFSPTVVNGTIIMENNIKVAVTGPIGCVGRKIGTKIMITGKEVEKRKIIGYAVAPEMKLVLKI